MTRASSPDVVLIVSAVAATSTLCETSPTTKLRSTVMRAPATKSFPVFLSVLKPDCSAITLYTPTGRSLATKYPLESVVVCLTSFVSSLTTVIFTPATEPPCESVTVPAIRPKMLWAAAVSTIQTVHKTANISHTVFNTSLRNSPPQTSWFDPDSLVLTRTPPPSKNRDLDFLLFLLASLLFSSHPVSAWPPAENLGRSLAQRLAYCIARRHLSHSPALK